MWWFPRAWRRQQPAKRPTPRPFYELEPRSDDDAPPRGCAWFDSSHELRAGLLVSEVRPGPELQLLLWTQSPR